MIKVLVMGEKLNVVDSNNNLVGFDLANDCCANGGYFITPDIKDKNFTDVVGLPETDFPKYVFDPDFLKEFSDGDGGGCLIFRMKPEYKWSENKNMPDLYLHLFNCHNGYYSKGFKYSFKEIKTGSI